MPFWFITPLAPPNFVKGSGFTIDTKRRLKAGFILCRESSGWNMATLAEMCGKTGWQVHAWCLMPNHFHLVAETPQPDLVVGLRWFYTAQLAA
jgi:REP element-mobilizing transposase RayT